MCQKVMEWGPRALVVMLMAGLLFAAGCSDKKTPKDDPPAEGAQPDAAQPDAATPADAAPDSSAAASNGLDVSLVLPKFCIAAIVHPARIVKSPIVAPFLQMEELAGPMQMSPVDPATIERVIMLASPQTLAGLDEPPFDEEAVMTTLGLVVRFTQPTDAKELVTSLLRLEAPPDAVIELPEKEIAGKKGVLIPPTPLAACNIDDRTIAVAEESLLGEMLAGGGEASPLKSRLEKVDLNADVILVVALEPLQELVTNATKGLEQGAPPPLAPFIPAPNMLSALTVALDLTGETMLKVDLEAKSDADAAKLNQLAADALKLGKSLFEDQKSQIPPDKMAEAGLIVNMVDQFLAGIGVDQAATTVSISLKTPEGLATKLKPMVEQAMAAARGSAERANDMMALKEIGLAFQNSDSATRKFPTQAICDKDGKPLLSWRVAILPYLGEDDLYDLFNLDEPWDSPNNKPLLEEFVGVYAVGQDDWVGNTSLFVVTGEGFVFDGQKQASTATCSRDGTSQTILAVQAGPDKAVPWTKPEDLAYTPGTDPLAILGNIPGKTVNVAFCDGSVEMLEKAALTPKRFLAFLTAAGNDSPYAKDEGIGPGGMGGPDMRPIDPGMGEPKMPPGGPDMDGMKVPPSGMGDKVPSGMGDKVPAGIPIEPAPAADQPGFRTWTSANGNFSVEAKLISQDGTNITIQRKDNNQTLTLPLTTFGQPDQDYANGLK